VTSVAMISIAKFKQVKFLVVLLAFLPKILTASFLEASSGEVDFPHLFLSHYLFIFPWHKLNYITQ
jgi:hypothetical protein